MSSLQIVGALNVTPDSFHDGGQFDSVDAAVKRAGEMLDEGAEIIEIGGESTGPGSEDVSAEEEIERTIPVIKAIKEKYPGAALSIDTNKSEVAKAAIDAGVMMVNDITAGRNDPKMFEVVAGSDVKLVLMYSKDETPRTTIDEVSYKNVVQTITEFLAKRKEEAVVAGIDPSRIILDPGMGHFISSSPQYSFEVIAHLGEFLELGEIFISPSRKSFLAGSENLKTADRLPGTIAASALAALNGASYIRTHDVLEVRRGCEAALSMKGH